MAEDIRSTGDGAVKFFVPYADDAAPAEHVWQATRDFLAMQGMPTEERRISKLAFEAAGRRQVIRVGRLWPNLNEEVLVILKAAESPSYYVCTASHGVVRGVPLIMDNASGAVLAASFTS